MHRFKVGQKVVAVKSHSQGTFKKGNVFTVESLVCCARCGKLCIVLEEIRTISQTRCTGFSSPGCGYINSLSRSFYAERAFAPLQNNADAIEYRLNVSIKELEVKEYQNQ